MSASEADAALDAALASLGPLRPACPLVCRVAPGDARGWERWADLTAPDGVRAWLAGVAGGDPAGRMPDAVAASFVAGRAAACLLAPGVTMIAACGRAPELDAGRLLVRRAPGGWIEGAHVPGCGLCAGEGAPAAGYAARAHAVLAPLVDTLAVVSARRSRFLWGRVVDAAHAVALDAQRHGAGYDLALRMWAVAGDIAARIATRAGSGPLPAPRPFTAGSARDPVLHCHRATCCLAHRTPTARARRARGEETRCAGCPLRSG